MNVHGLPVGPRKLTPVEAGARQAHARAEQAAGKYYTKLNATVRNGRDLNQHIPRMDG